MGVWSKVEEVKSDIESARSDVMSEWQSARTDVESIGPDLTSKCQEVVGEFKG
jgi:hypothetical protein